MVWTASLIKKIPESEPLAFSGLTHLVAIWTPTLFTLLFTYSVSDDDYHHIRLTTHNEEDERLINWNNTPEVDTHFSLCLLAIWFPSNFIWYAWKSAVIPCSSTAPVWQTDGWWNETTNFCQRSLPRSKQLFFHYTASASFFSYHYHITKIYMYNVNAKNLQSSGVVVVLG